MHGSHCRHADTCLGGHLLSFHQSANNSDYSQRYLCFWGVHKAPKLQENAVYTYVCNFLDIQEARAYS